MERCSYTDQWLLFLSRNNIRTLILDVHDYEAGLFQVHSSLYYCQNLTHLELFHCEIPQPPPSFRGFFFLRCLVLHKVDMPSDTIESLVANSPFLEELTLYDYVQFVLRICAPSLKYFYFSGICTEICLYAPLLAILTVFLSNNNFTDEHLQRKSPVCNYIKLLGGVANLEELSGNLSFIKYLSIGIESCQRSLMFDHLRVIEICPMSIDDVKLISVVVRLIMGAPNLHKLIISCSYSIEYASGVASLSFRHSEFASNFTFERLKVIEMRNVHGGLHEMKFIKFLLESSPVLETMILKPYQDLTGEQLLNMTAELLRFRRASTNAEILFRKS